MLHAACWPHPAPRSSSTLALALVLVRWQDNRASVVMVGNKAEACNEATPREATSHACACSIHCFDGKPLTNALGGCVGRLV